MLQSKQAMQAADGRLRQPPRVIKSLIFRRVVLQCNLRVISGYSKLGP